MRKTTIITAKMQSRFFDLVLAGTKRYEVRDEPFGDAQAIRYIDSEDGRELGIYRIEETLQLRRDEDDRLIDLAGISKDEFYELFPPVSDGGPSKLWVARIGEPIDIRHLLREAI